MTGRLTYSRSEIAQTTISNNLSANGSTALAFIFTAFVALSVTLTFVNLVRYVGATNAVDQAARSTTRCLTPTDPDCIQYVSAPTQVMLDWWGYNNQTGADPEGIFVDTYDYEATMYRQNWQQSFTSYDIHKVRPVLSYSSYHVPRKTFERNLNAWEQQYASLRGCARETNVFRPVHTSLFPHYFNPWEQALDNSSSSSWAAYCFSRSVSGAERCCADPDDNNCNQDASPPDLGVASQVDLDNDVTLSSANTSEWFGSGWHDASIIPGATSGSACEDEFGRNCDTVISQSSGGNGHWWSRTQVAFKIDALVCNDTTNNASMGWAQILVEGKRADGSVYNIPAKGPHNGGYGGRSAESIPDDSCRWYNLWLRGPKNSHGGGSPGDYEDIHVARGDQFRVRARMDRQSGTVRVDKVVFRIFLDEYESGGNYQCNVCPGVIGNPGSGYRQMPPLAGPLPGVDGPATPQLCGFAPNWTWDVAEPLQLITAPISVPSCTGNAGDSFPTPAPGLLTLQATVCSASWTPQNNPPPAGRLFCSSWQEQSHQGPWPMSNVATVPGGCSLAQNHTETPIVCDHDYTFDVSGVYGNKSSCSPAVDSAVTAKNSATDSVNGSQPPNAPQFAHMSTSNISWDAPQEYTPLKWEFSWQSAGGVNICNCSQLPQQNCSPVTCHDNHLLLNIGVIYRHNVGSSWAIGDSDFPAFSSLPGGDGQNPPQGNPDNLSYALLGEITEQLTGFPFSEPTPGIHWGNLADVGQYDYDADCTPDDECSAQHHDYASLDEWLRVQAAGSVPQAVNTDLVFDHSEQWLGTQQYTPGQFQNASLPPCTKARSVCQDNPDSNSLAYLGRFSNAVYPSGPAACHDGTWDGCSSQVVGGSIQEPGVTQNVNFAAARSRGCEELHRFDSTIPQSVCDNIAIDTTSGPMANVQVSYNMPVTPPFDMFVGSEYVTVSSENSEVMEMKMVGRQ